jgi:hypothetical protein
VRFKDTKGIVMKKLIIAALVGFVLMGASRVEAYWGPPGPYPYGPYGYGPYYGPGPAADAGIVGGMALGSMLGGAIASSGRSSTKSGVIKKQRQELEAKNAEIKKLKANQ